MPVSSKMPKKRRVPEVLWRVFRDRARPLLNAIVSLLPPPPPAASEQCRWCQGRRCIDCVRGGGDAAIMSFLLRPDDPTEYRKLLTRCFVIVDDKATPLSDFGFHVRWTQRQIVLRTIDMVLWERSSLGNVISIGFNKENNSSAIIELLTSSAWCLLLERVGGNTMIYLLKHGVVFLPYPCKKHIQVVGPPLTKLNNWLTKHASESHYQRAQKKRKKAGNAKLFLDMEKSNSSLSNGTSSVASSDTYVWAHHNGTIIQKNVTEVVTSTATSCAPSNDKTVFDVVGESLDQNVLMLKKRSRPFSWQRHGKKRRINSHENGAVFSEILCTVQDNLSGCSQQKSYCTSSFLSGQKPMLCSCCQLLLTAEKFTRGAHIQRRLMFYNLESFSTIFPRTHVLNSLKPNVADSVFLLQEIFGLPDLDVNSKAKTCSHSSCFCSNGSACPYHSTIKLLKTLIRRTQCCQYSRLLNKHCPLPLPIGDTSGNSHRTLEVYGMKHQMTKLETGDLEFEELKLYSSKSQVVAFIWAVCRSIVPPELLGTPVNWRILRRNIYKFIELRRFEQFSLKQCMQKLRVTRFSLLSNGQMSVCCNAQVLGDAAGGNVGMYGKGYTELNEMMSGVRDTLLQRWIYWFFSWLVVPLVQANFYVTESEHGKQDVFYFRKSVWQKLTNRAMNRLSGQSYTCLNDEYVRSILSRRSFGFSKLRFCPKENGLRILANLKSSSRVPALNACWDDQSHSGQKNRHYQQKAVKFDHFRSVNSVLGDLQAVLKGLKLKEPEKLGSSVFDYNDVYKKLCPFLIGLKDSSAKLSPVFIVVADVSKAFDSINQDKLLRVLEDVIAKPGYRLEEFSSVVCRKKSLRVSHNLALAEKHTSTNPGRLVSSLPFRSLHAVIIDQERRRYIKQQKLFSILIEHVKQNIVRFDKSFFLQCVGIPQGSIVSSLLCSFYYGHLERIVIFPFLERPHESDAMDFSAQQLCQDTHNSDDMTVFKEDIMSNAGFLLLRFIDDFLFLSTSKAQAASFFSRLRRGFRDYNCFMNEEKFGLNFGVGSKPAVQSHRTCNYDAGYSFLRWSGLLINSETLEVQADYTRYLRTRLRATLTVRWQGKPGAHLKAKLCDFLRPKCHPLFFDSNINSAAVVRLNIYQVFLLCAMKFHCYVCDLSYICKMKARSHLNMIMRSFRYMFVLIKKKMRKASLGPSHRPVLQLLEWEVEWLGLVAYIRVLEKKQSRHRDLLALLKSKFFKHRITGNIYPQLKYAVDRSHSSVIWRIKY